MQLAFQSYDSFFINDRNMTDNSVEKHCFTVLNAKLLVEIKFKTFTHFQNCYILLSP